MNNKKIPLVAIVGPTASGKTALSISLAKHFDAEIVSADSMQIYEGMDIATAKPTVSEMDNIVHHLIGFVKTDRKFSVADYINIARDKIKEINSQNKKIIIVGGTGLYINSLIDNIKFEEEENNGLREKLNIEAQKYGGEHLLNQLRELDPEYAKKLHSNDLGRIIRGIEINTIFGHSMAEHKRLSRAVESEYTPLIIGIDYKDRQKLYDRINKRVDLMIENGLVEEAKHFYSKLDSDKTAIQAIGYKEIFPFLEGKLSLEEAIENLKKATRNYAKRQLTWFRKDSRVNWLYADELSSEEVLEKAKELCNLLYIS